MQIQRITRAPHCANVVWPDLGHSSIGTTMDVYAHVSLDLERQAMETLNAALRGGLQWGCS